MPHPNSSINKETFPFSALSIPKDILEEHGYAFEKVFGGGCRGSKLDPKIGGGRYHLLGLRLNKEDRLLFVNVSSTVIYLQPIFGHRYELSPFFNEQYLTNWLENNKECILKNTLTREELLEWISNRLGHNKVNEDEQAAIDWLPMMQYNKRWITLTSPQADTLEDLEEPSLISGPGGAGKSLLLVAKVTQYINNQPPQNTGKILYVTPQKILAEKLERNFLRLHLDLKGFQVIFRDQEALYRELLAFDQECSDWEIANVETFKTWFKQFNKLHWANKTTLSGQKNRTHLTQEAAFYASEKTQLRVFEELQWLFYAKTYKKQAPGHSNLRFPAQEQQDYLNLVLNNYLEHLKNTKQIQLEFYQVQCPQDKRYSFVVFDEGQLLSPQGLLNLLKITVANRLLTTADSQQNIIQQNSIRPFILSIFHGLNANPNKVHFILKQCLRCSFAISNLFNEWLKITQELLGGLSDRYEYPQIEPDPYIQGQVFVFSGLDEMSQAQETVKKHCNRAQLVVLVRPHPKNPALPYPKDEALAEQLFNTKAISSVYNYLGREQKNVVLLNLLSDLKAIDSLINPMSSDGVAKNRSKKEASNQQVATELHQISVAIGRGINNVIIVQTLPAHPIRNLLTRLKTAAASTRQINAIPIVVEEEKIEDWEKIVKDLFQRGDITQAKKIYEKELAASLGSWENFKIRLAIKKEPNRIFSVSEWRKLLKNTGLKKDFFKTLTHSNAKNQTHFLTALLENPNKNNLGVLEEIIQSQPQMLYSFAIAPVTHHHFLNLGKEAVFPKYMSMFCQKLDSLESMKKVTLLDLLFKDFLGLLKPKELRKWEPLFQFLLTENSDRLLNLNDDQPILTYFTQYQLNTWIDACFKPADFKINWFLKKFSPTQESPFEAALRLNQTHVLQKLSWQEGFFDGLRKQYDPIYPYLYRLHRNFSIERFKNFLFELNFIGDYLQKIRYFLTTPIYFNLTFFDLHFENKTLVSTYCAYFHSIKLEIKHLEIYLNLFVNDPNSLLNRLITKNFYSGLSLAVQFTTSLFIEGARLEQREQEVEKNSKESVFSEHIELLRHKFSRWFQRLPHIKDKFGKIFTSLAGSSIQTEQTVILYYLIKDYWSNLTAEEQKNVLTYFINHSEATHSIALFLGLALWKAKDFSKQIRALLYPIDAPLSQKALSLFLKTIGNEPLQKALKANKDILLAFDFDFFYTIRPDLLIEMLGDFYGTIMLNFFMDENPNFASCSKNLSYFDKLLLPSCQQPIDFFINLRKKCRNGGQLLLTLHRANPNFFKIRHPNDLIHLTKLNAGLSIIEELLITNNSKFKQVAYILLNENPGIQLVDSSIFYKKVGGFTIFETLAKKKSGLQIIEYLVKTEKTIAKQVTWKLLSTPSVESNLSPLQYLFFKTVIKPFKWNSGFPAFVLACPSLIKREGISTLQKTYNATNSNHGGYQISFWDHLSCYPEGKQLQNQLKACSG